MTAKCLMCGDDIILACNNHCELSVNRYVCGVCVDLVEEGLLRVQLEKLLAVKEMYRAKD